MRNSNDAIITNGDMSTASITSDVINMENILFLAVQGVWTGTPTGTLKLQGSCDTGLTIAGNVTGSGVTNWTDITSATTAPSGSAGSGFIEVKETGLKWVRAVYTRSSGSGTLNVRFNAKGI